MRRKQRQADKIFTIGVIVFVVALVTTTGLIVWQLLRGGSGKGKNSISENGNGLQQVEDLSQYPYIMEVNYIGPLKYMELYDHPFGKTDSYKMNKDMAAGTEEASEFAKKAVESLLTVSHRDIEADPGTMLSKIEELTDPYGLFIFELPGYPEMESAEALAEAISDMYVANEFDTEATFITNSSLVFEDIYCKCRGVIELKGYGGANASGMECIPVDVLLKQTEDSFELVGIVPVEDWPEFDGVEE